MSSVEALRGDVVLDLPEFDDPPGEPLGLLRTWVKAAVAQQVREPLAVVLATADATGRPSSRVVLLKDADDRGLVFTSARDSRKGLELAVRPWASATFYWRETLQQLTVEGPVEEVTDLEADRLFAERPAGARAASTVSEQGRPLADEDELRRRAAAASASLLVRPDTWTGYRLVPEAVEFWLGSQDRLHRRLRYVRTAGAGWEHGRLQP